jgi:hypothetical protein
MSDQRSAISFFSVDAKGIDLEGADRRGRLGRLPTWNGVVNRPWSVVIETGGHGGPSLQTLTHRAIEKVKKLIADC